MATARLEVRSSRGLVVWTEKTRQNARFFFKDSRQWETQWNPDFSNLQEKQKLVCKIEEFGVKLQCSTEKRKATFGSHSKKSVRV